MKDQIEQKKKKKKRVHNDKNDIEWLGMKWLEYGWSKISYESTNNDRKINTTGYEMTTLGTKWLKWYEMTKYKNKSEYEMTKMVRNDMGMKWLGYELAWLGKIKPNVICKKDDQTEN